MNPEVEFYTTDIPSLGPPEGVSLPLTLMDSPRCTLCGCAPGPEVPLPP